MKKFLILLSLLPVAAFATMEWKKTEINYNAKPEETEVKANYFFVNTGDKSIKIVDTKTSCGCTVASLEKDTIAPGEIGSIKAIFSFGERVGQQHKVITVYTDDSATPMTNLTLNVNIPAFLSIEPQLLYWSKGEAPKAKSAIITVLSSAPINVTKANVDDTKFDAELTPLEEGHSYRLTVTPKSTAEQQQDRAVIETNVGTPEHPRTGTIALQIY